MPETFRCIECGKDFLEEDTYTCSACLQTLCRKCVEEADCPESNYGHLRYEEREGKKGEEENESN